VKFRKLLWIVVVVVVAIMVLRIANRITNSKIIETERSIPVVATSPTVGAIEDKLSLTGDIKARKEVSVRPRIGGRVEEIYVDEGDEVEKGAALLSYVAGIQPDNDLYDDMVVTAPISGIIGMKMVKEGDQVMTQSGAINPVFTIYDIDSMKIYCDVPEKNYSELYVGMPAEVRIDAIPDETFKGKVFNIRPVIDPMTRTTKIEIRLANSDHGIKPGMFANVDLILKGNQKALIIPFDAILGDTDKYVLVDEAGIAVKKPVKTGIRQDNNVEILSGLSSSDRVLTEGERVVKEGSKITETK